MKYYSIAQLKIVQIIIYDEYYPVNVIYINHDNIQGTSNT